jgi:hypothetical protein
MRLVQTAKKTFGPVQHTKYRNNLFDNDIKGQGHSDVILLLETHSLVHLHAKSADTGS